MNKTHFLRVSSLSFLTAVFSISCNSTPEAAKQLQTEAEMAEKPMGTVLTEVDGYLRVWNNLKLSPPTMDSQDRLRAVEEMITKTVRDRFDDFVEQIEKGNTRNRIIAVAVLGFSKDSRAVPYLVRELSQTDPKILANALMSLGILGDKQTPLEPLIRILQTNTDSRVRVDAAYTLQRLAAVGVDGKPIRFTLQQALQDPEPGVRAQAAAGLGILKDQDSVPSLITLLRDPKTLISAAAAFALGEIGDARGVKPLISALESSSPRLREEAHAALIKITGEDRGSSAWNWKGL